MSGEFAGHMLQLVNDNAELRTLVEQLRAERDEAKRLQETERQRADAYSFRLNQVSAENQELLAQLKQRAEADPGFGAARQLQAENQELRESYRILTLQLAKETQQ